MVGRLFRVATTASAVAAGLVLVQAPAVAEQGCTGATASTNAQAARPFGAVVVAPTTRLVESFGQDVIRPEATAPHDACP